ncbi:MAG: site-specific integrase [Desulfobacteraceae bacterium]|nr:site-specific integrase [Desulfobacteraceae bacterium]
MGVKVRQKKQGKGNPWWIFINHEGQRKSIKVGDKRTAERKAAKIEKMLKSGQYQLNAEPEEKTVTFKALSREWLSEIKITRKASTHERYNQILDSHILPKFGKRGIADITKGEIKTFFIKKIEEGFSRSSVAIFRDVMSGVFNNAIDQEIIEANPTLGITKKLSLAGGKDQHVDPLDFSETQTFLETCKSFCPEHHAFFFTALRTGMRLGELLALQWGDIDFNSGYILVRRTYKRGQFTEPKNKKTRKVDISEALVEVLENQATLEKKETLRRGWTEPPELVFTVKDGNPIEQNDIRRVFKRTLKKAGLREIRFHDLRHTYASQMLSLGESPVYVKEQLGHHSIQLTVDTYGHWIPTEKRCGANKLDDPELTTGVNPRHSSNRQESAPKTHPGNIKAVTP